MGSIGAWIFKILLSGSIITFGSWLAQKNTKIAGFFMALPVATLITLVIAQVEGKAPQISIDYAKSIFVGVPLTLVFFIPFLFSFKWLEGFWIRYFCGIGLLSVAYLIHSIVYRYLFKGPGPL